jgi:hypothetical protein
MDTEAAPAGGVAGAEATRQADEPVSDAEAEDILTMLGAEEGRMVTCLDCACRELVTYMDYGWTAVCRHHFDERKRAGMGIMPPYWFDCRRWGEPYVHRER